MIKFLHQLTNTNYHISTNNCRNKFNSSINNVYVSDSFTKQPNNINFQGVDKKNDTSNGRFLKALKNITDPYSGIKLLTYQEMEQISHDLSQINNSQKKIRYLKKYEKSMLPVEYDVYKYFEFKTRKDYFVSFSKLLKQQKPTCIKRLQFEQSAIFDKMEDATKNISPKNRKLIMAEVNEGRRRILINDDDKHSFKRKMFIDNLIQLQCEEILDATEKDLLKNRKFYGLSDLAEARERFEKEPLNHAKDGKTPVDLIIDLKHKYIPDYNDEFKNVVQIARELPTSNTSVNAFVIKYADRSDKEITERLLNQSVASVEHIEADSMGGDNEADNFMLVSTARNVERGNLPIKAFIKMHPEIYNNTQKYMNDIIKNVYRGKLKGYEWYPYVLKDTLHNNGIDVDISNYSISPQEAFKTLPPRLRNRYPNYKEFIPDKTEPLNIKV